ncbi:MAG: hypothetical protein CM1200mP2_53070 [Planctomycetaceae bacterium]|nr:MAG: hypothetical protein CM1200mP2_53070 [Planctomycetaceae bacterium]
MGFPGPGWSSSLGITLRRTTPLWGVRVLLVRVNCSVTVSPTAACGGAAMSRVRPVCWLMAGCGEAGAGIVSMADFGGIAGWPAVTASTW